jgi:hypothetical protein
MKNDNLKTESDSANVLLGEVKSKKAMATTPLEKATELVNKYTHFAYTNVFSFREESNWNYSKKCALVAVDEILLACATVGCMIDKRLNDKTLSEGIIEDGAFKYWNAVKDEIIKLKLPSA